MVFIPEYWTTCARYLRVGPSAIGICADNSNFIDYSNCSTKNVIEHRVGGLFLKFLRGNPHVVRMSPLPFRLRFFELQREVQIGRFRSRQNFYSLAEFL